jgi:hypothetical protein
MLKGGEVSGDSGCIKNWQTQLKKVFPKWNYIFWIIVNNVIDLNQIFLVNFVFEQLLRKLVHFEVHYILKGFFGIYFLIIISYFESPVKCQRYTNVLLISRNKLIKNIDIRLNAKIASSQITKPSLAYYNNNR